MKSCKKEGIDFELFKISNSKSRRRAYNISHEPLRSQSYASAYSRGEIIYCIVEGEWEREIYNY